jgi:hypothetical protein
MGRRELDRYIGRVTLDALRNLLECAPGGGVALDIVQRNEFDEALLRRLYELSNTLMAEPFEHFSWHAGTNDELHVFRRRDSGEVMGFQFWRTLPGISENHRVVLGGKLRVRPEARRRGLHLASGFAVLSEQRRRFPEAAITRLGIASMFGFVSIARRVAHHDFVTAQTHPELVPIVEAVTSASHYTFDAQTGQVEVGIFITPQQLAGYPEAFFQSPLARAYAERNPEYRSNGRYLAFAFEVDEANVGALARGVVESAGGHHPDAGALSEALVAGFFSGTRAAVTK